MNFQIDVQCMHTFRVGEIGMEPQLLASAICNQSPPNLIDAINYSTDTGNFINEAISTDRRYPVDILHPCDIKCWYRHSEIYQG